MLGIQVLVKYLLHWEEDLKKIFINCDILREEQTEDDLLHL